MILGLIPARKMSKRLPGKNMLDLGGKPLIEWTLTAAIRSKFCRCIDHVAVTTDDEQVALLSDLMTVPVIRRDPALCGDDVPMLPVVLDAAERNPDAAAVVLLQPTSPFRTEWHICEALRQWSRKRPLVSVRPDGTENGAIFISLVSWMKNYQRIYDEEWRDFDCFMMNNMDSVDIDTQEDLDLARSMCRRQ